MSDDEIICPEEPEKNKESGFEGRETDKNQFAIGSENTTLPDYDDASSDIRREIHEMSILRTTQF